MITSLENGGFKDIYTSNVTSLENGTTALIPVPFRHRRVRSPKKVKRYQRQRLLALRKLFELEKPKTVPPEIILQRRRAYAEKYGPFSVGYAPRFLTDLYEASCAPKAQAEKLKKLANLDPRMSVLKIVNRKTGLVDKEFTARMIKRYREDPGQSSATAFAASGIVDELREGISVLKLNHYEPGEPSGTVVTASGIADEVMRDCA